MSNEPLAALVQRVGAFTEAVGDLAGKVTGLSGEVAGLRKRAGRHAGWIALDIALSVATIALGFILGGEVDAKGELIAQQEATIARLDKSVRSQCGQLALFIGSYRPESRPPDGREEYENAFRVMRGQYADLDCDPEAIVPPMTPTPAPPPR